MRSLLGLLASLAFVGGSLASPPTVLQVETEYLIRYVELSDCAFYRNGSRYAGAEAGAHLRAKYAAFAASRKIVTAESFIDMVATKSSLTGIPYEVSCLNGPRVGSARWLLDALSQFRSTGALRESRDAR